MEALFVYLIKSGALIAAFYLSYFFLLRKETFFKSNRWFLLFGLVTSVLLPLVTFKKVIWVEPTRKVMECATTPMYYLPAGPASPTQETFEINWILVMAVIYAIGISAFLLRFFSDFYALKKALKGKKVYQQADFRFVDTDENISPFSYFNYIVFNSALYSESELENILEHEKVHSNQNHTMDVLLARLFCIAFWFNPFVWLYKKAILQNLEFIADSEAAKNISDIKSYQITLLKVTAHENCVDITNHFYQSLIKKRIVMLNKNQSKKWNSWKYVLIVPALAAFLFYFQVKVVAMEKNNPLPAVQTQSQPDIHVTVDKNSSDADLKHACSKAKEEGVSLKFSKVKRNSNGEIIAIKAQYKDKSGKKGVTQVSGDEPIKPIRFFKNDEAIGFGAPRPVRIYSNGTHSTVEEDGTYSFSFGSGGDNEFIVEAPEAPEMPEMPEGLEAPEPPEAPESTITINGETMKIGDNMVISKSGKGSTIITVDGKVVVDSDKILADMDPIIVDGVNVLDGKKVKVYGKNATVIDTRKITAEAMENAREAMEKARPQMEKARADMKRSQPEMEQARKEMEQARKEMEEARKASKAEMEEARAEMVKARIELEKERAKLEKARAGQTKK